MEKLQSLTSEVTNEVIRTDELQENGLHNVILNEIQRDTYIRPFIAWIYVNRLHVAEK